ncbi:CPBP family intramembrane metalloprotease [Mangrovivirga sp. M17]|uniref:CPBP family intramembrane metalloprotease n=1 Tax=Mangrovivirga halotolerans TaxID=2993936 RepID=A0ABT3RPU9_9BACT|nr:CPBP family intramembrane glutamic endopeptidase [Mangrovivirga halotolerans]MCX2743368.1 CPBP family intramembrane metalloprotease [Mangrovivirga halotolerans]
MLGILVILLISWILLYVFQRKSILALGVLPVHKRLLQFLIGFCITAILCLGVELAKIPLYNLGFNLNQSYDLNMLAGMLLWDMKSVVTEELLFRGALLIILIKKLGKQKGLLISALAFGIYHWFSYGIFGNVVPMIIVLIGTGLMGYAWALSFAKTQTILMPIGLHLGWNFTFNTIFSNGPLGEGVFLSDGGAPISDWYSLVGLIGVPIVVFLIVKYLFPTEKDKNEPSEVLATATN